MLNVMSVTTSAPSEEDLANGATPEIIMSLGLGIVLPLADPANPSQPVVVPGGQVRFRLDGEAAEEVGNKMAEEGARLPRRSRLEIASSVSAAEEAARRLESLRG